MKKNLFLAGGSLLFAVILLELALRVLGIGYPSFTQVDIWTGWRLRPGAAGWQRDEGNAYVRINSEGWRDRERDILKPNDTVRVAVLGDSFVEARQVDQEETLTAVAEKELAACPALAGRTAEVLNFGVSGFGTAQELLALQQYVWPYRPDVIVLTFTPGNDVRNNSAALERNDQKPFAVLSGSTLEINMSFRKTPFFVRQQSTIRRLAQAVLRSSRILQIAYRATRSSSKEKTSGGTATAPAGVETGLDTEIFKDIPAPEWQQAWNITDTLLSAMNAQARTHQAPFVVMTATQGIQVHPDHSTREQFESGLGVKDLFAPERRIAAFGERDGFAVLALAPAFQREAENAGTFFHGFAETGLGTGHWNEAGHAAAGTALAKFLCENVLR